MARVGPGLGVSTLVLFHPSDCNSQRGEEGRQHHQSRIHRARLLTRMAGFPVLQATQEGSMAIDWSARPPQAEPPQDRPEIVPGITMLEVFTVRVLEGEHEGKEANITRAFRSWSPGQEGEQYVHAWDENLQIGFVFDLTNQDETHNELGGTWIQYSLDARALALPRHDERGTRRVDNPSGDLSRTPFGANPSAALAALGTP